MQPRKVQPSLHCHIYKEISFPLSLRNILILLPDSHGHTNTCEDKPKPPLKRERLMSKLSESNVSIDGRQHIEKQHAIQQDQSILGDHGVIEYVHCCTQDTNNN